MPDLHNPAKREKCTAAFRKLRCFFIDKVAKSPICKYRKPLNQKKNLRRSSLLRHFDYDSLISPEKFLAKILRTSSGSSVCPSAHISFVTAASVVISPAGITPVSSSFRPTS